jgi:uncharacterized protein YdeI (BOF family)
MQRFHLSLFVLLLTGLVLAGCDSSTGIPDDLGSNSQVGFASSDTTVSEDAGTVTIDVTATDPGYKTFSVQAVLTDQGTLGPNDFDGPESVTLNFPQSTTSGGSQSFTVSIVDDNLFLEGDETVVYELQGADGVALSETTTFTLTVEDDDTVGAPQTIETARSQALGDAVTVRGIVLRKDGSNVFIQDDSGPTGASGIVVRDGDLADAYEAGDIQPGDLLQAEGELGAFSGLLQVSGDVTYYELERDTQALPDPQTVTVADLLNGGGEDYESEWVTITDLTIDPDGDATFQDGTNYDVTDSSTMNSTALRIIDESFYVGEPIPSGAVTFTGVVGQFNFGFGGARGPDDGYQLFAIMEGDLE